MKVKLDRASRKVAGDLGAGDRLVAHLGDIQDLDGELASSIVAESAPLHRRRRPGRQIVHGRRLDGGAGARKG